MIDTDYIISIDKETLGHLPVMTFPGEITVVDTPSVAHTALRALSRHKVVGFDTETRPSFRKGTRHKVALMQISTGDRCFLFRLNVLGISSELRAFLQNPSVTKVGLSLHDDFASLSWVVLFCGVEDEYAIVVLVEKILHEGFYVVGCHSVDSVHFAVEDIHAVESGGGD